jgi:hypothetical protein
MRSRKGAHTLGTQCIGNFLGKRHLKSGGRGWLTPNKHQQPHGTWLCDVTMICGSAQSESNEKLGIAATE